MNISISTKDDWRRLYGAVSAGKLLQCLLFCLFFYHNCSVTVAAANRDFSEAKIKVVYLYNFLRFIEWPPSAATFSDDICIVGQKKKYRDAISLLKKLTLNEHALSIGEFGSQTKLDDLKNCRLVFITEDATHRSGAICDTVKEASSLTVGESKDFARDGGMINFIRRKDKIHFEVNLRAARQAGLRITSKILRIADEVIE